MFRCYIVILNPLGHLQFDVIYTYLELCELGSKNLVYREFLLIDLCDLLFPIISTLILFIMHKLP